jgi:hypothetical protein
MQLCAVELEAAALVVVDDDIATDFFFVALAAADDVVAVVEDDCGGGGNKPSVSHATQDGHSEWLLFKGLLEEEEEDDEEEEEEEEVDDSCRISEVGVQSVCNDCSAGTEDTCDKITNSFTRLLYIVIV